MGQRVKVGCMFVKEHMGQMKVEVVLLGGVGVGMSECEVRKGGVVRVMRGVLLRVVGRGRCWRLWCRVLNRVGAVVGWWEA